MEQLTIKRNSRQIPSSKEICSNKCYNDILYGYLQMNTEKIETKDGRILRLVPKKLTKFTLLADKLKVSRQTVSKKFKNLYDMNLIVDFNNDYYQLIELNRNEATLIPSKTLQAMIDTLSENSISIYVCLLNLYYMNGLKPFTFTLEQLKAFVGICKSTRSNDEVINNILRVLQKLELIKYSLTAAQQDEYSHIKTIYKLDYITNELNLD